MQILHSIRIHTITINVILLWRWNALVLFWQLKFRSTPIEIFFSSGYPCDTSYVSPGSNKPRDDVNMAWCLNFLRLQTLHQQFLFRLHNDMKFKLYYDLRFAGTKFHQQFLITKSVSLQDISVGFIQNGAHGERSR